jgi:hypothetical protein
MATGRSRRQGEAHEITVESFNIRVRLVAGRADVLERAIEVLPPGSRPVEGGAVDTVYTIEETASGAFDLTRDGKTFVDDLSLDVAIWWLGRELSDAIAFKATDHIFVHAGAVAHLGKAIVLPGATYAGKTTLVAALVRAGAVYLSDEFAPIDQAGMVHPYARRLSIRDEGPGHIDHDVASLGGVAGVDAVPLGLLVLTTYQDGAEWRPRRISPGDAVLALLANAVQARTRPEQALEAFSRSVRDALALQSDRGEADEVAPRLLAELETQ